MNSTLPIHANTATPAMKMIDIYLVDDQAILRAALRSRIKENDNFQVVGDSGDPRAALEDIARLKPHVVILDIAMRGLSGIDAIGKIKKVNPRGRIVMLTQHEGESFVQQSLAAGAEGYLSKDSDPAELRLAIEAVHRGDYYISPKVAGALVVPSQSVTEDGRRAGSRLDSLTTREREVFQLLVLGKSNKEVAVELGIRLGTVKKHRENLQRKLDTHSAAELARLAMREGLLDS